MFARHGMRLVLVLALACAASAADLTEEQKQAIDKAIAAQGLNEYGDPQGTMYTGGTPLFDERTGTSTDRYQYIAQKHPEFLGPPIPAPSSPPSPGTTASGLPPTPPTTSTTGVPPVVPSVSPSVSPSALPPGFSPGLPPTPPFDPPSATPSGAPAAAAPGAPAARDSAQVPAPERESLTPGLLRVLPRVLGGRILTGLPPR